MKTDNPWLDGMFAHEDTLNQIAYQIGELSSAFMRTGNEIVSAELFLLKKSIHAEADKVRLLTQSKVDVDYKEALQGSKNMLNAALAGVKVRVSG